MTAAAANRGNKEEQWKFIQFTLLSGKVAFQGASASLRAGKVVPTAVGSNLTDRVIGSFAEKVDATLADKLVLVDLIEEITVRWYANAAGGAALLSTDLGSVAYFLDDQTVTNDPAANVPAGRVWAVDSTKGVAIEKLDTPTAAAHLAPALPAFAAGDTAPTTIVNGGVYDIPATAAASTISLPTAAPDGTVAYFIADGTKNGHTLTFRDVATAISAATTASKRVAATAMKANGKWAVHLTVGP